MKTKKIIPNKNKLIFWLGASYLISFVFNTMVNGPYQTWVWKFTMPALIVGVVSLFLLIGFPGAVLAFPKLLEKIDNRYDFLTILLKMLVMLLAIVIFAEVLMNGS